MEDIKTLLQKQGVEIAPKGNMHYREGWVNIRCPYCASLKFLLGILPTHATCFNCGPKHIDMILADICQVSRKDIREFKNENKDTKEVYRKKVHIGKYDPPKMSKDEIEKLSKLHREYIKGRRLDPDEIENLWKVKGLRQRSDVYSWSLFIPIHYRGNAVSWTTRTISKTETMRYRTATLERELIPAKDLLYGEDFAGNTISIHEGAFNVFTVGPGAVATMGVSYTEVQFARMCRYPNRYICFDMERAAQKRARELADKLKMFKGNTYVIELDANDINESSDRERSLFRRTVFKRR